MSNFQSLEVVGHNSETQCQVGENLNERTKGEFLVKDILAYIFPGGTLCEFFN